MVNNPGTGGLSRPRGGSMAASEENSDGPANDEQLGIAGSEAGVTAPLGALDDQETGQDAGSQEKSGSRSNTFDCVHRRQLLDPIRSSKSKQKGSDTEIGGRTEKDTKSEVSKWSCPDPPVTKVTLSELDVHRIVYNPKLRHDVNFDPDLHFRPNLDGESGRRKTQKANDFWICLKAQLEAFSKDPAAFESEFAGREWCLPLTLRATGEILGTLVPPDDRSAVEDVLNMELLMQQFRRGAADLDKLALWLSRTLKSHCAPMRDEWVDEMVSQLSVGNRNRDIASLVQGLQTLLAVLEAMKLDVANHQIRCLRPLLIQDSVEFEQTFFLKKIASSKIDTRTPHMWFIDVKALFHDDQDQANGLPGEMHVFFKGFVNLLLPSKMGDKLPDTFSFDEERIIKLRSDILDAINLRICMNFFQDLQHVGRFPERHLSTSSSLSRSPSSSPSPSSRKVAGKGSIKSPIAPRRSDIQRKIRISGLSRHTGRLNIQPTSDAVLYTTESDGGEDGSDTDSSTSSGTTSFSSRTSATAKFPLSQPREPVLRPEVDALRQSILAIINDKSGSSRWQQSCPDIALQLLRSTSSLDQHAKLESQLKSQLESHLSKPKSAVFQIAESQILEEFYPVLFDLVSRYASLSSTQLFEVATSPRPLPFQVQKPQHALSDAARQLAHMGILHWRVWSPLVYLVNPEDTGHVSDTRDRDSRMADPAWGVGSGNNRRRSPQRQNSLSESIPAGS